VVDKIWGRGRDDIYVAGGGSLFHSTDGGQTWPEELTPLVTPIHALGGDASSLFVIGASGLILRE